MTRVPASMQISVGTKDRPPFCCVNITRTNTRGAQLMRCQSPALGQIRKKGPAGIWQGVALVAATSWLARPARAILVVIVAVGMAGASRG